MAKNKKAIKTLAVAALATSALVPVASASAATTYSDVVVSVNGDLVTISQAEYNLAAALGKAPALDYIKVNGQYYAKSDYDLQVALGKADPFQALVTDAQPSDITTITGSVDESGNVVATPDTGELKVKSVSAISTTGVTVSFPALDADKEGVTVEVKDNKGNVVETGALDLLKGEKEATFKFTKALTEAPKGVWTVNGVSYDIDTEKLIQSVNDLAADSTLKPLDFYDALTELSIKNVKTDNLQAYANEIKKEKPTTVAAIQKAVNKANENLVTADEKKDIAVAVNEAKGNLVQLRSALTTNFKQVNTEWISLYQTKLTGTFGALNGKTKDTIVAADFDKIQADINTVNTGEISTAKGNVTSVKTANEYKALVATYMVEDTEGIDTKAKALKEADKFVSLMELDASESSVESYRLLTSLLGDDAKLLNDNLKKEYFDAKELATIDTSTTSANLVSNVVTVGDTTARDAALGTIKSMTAKTTGVEGTPVATVKANLQKLATVTSHKTGDDKFDMTLVKEAKLGDYRDALAGQTLANTKAVTDIIKAQNAQVEEQANLDVISDASSTTTQVRDALLNLALKETGNATATAFINAPSQVKLEVAQYIIDNRDKLVDPLTKASVVTNGSSSYATNALGKAAADQAAKVGQFNTDIGNLAVATTTGTKAALDTYSYAPYKALSAAQKVAVAEEINKLTKKDADGNAVSLNFAGDDAVKTLKAANDIIDAAITRVAE